MNVIDFIRASAAYLVADRPDVYDMPTAVEEISTCMDSLREGTHGVEVISFTSYILVRYDEDGMEEFTLTRKLAGIALDSEGEDCRAWSYDRGLDGLPYILDPQDDDVID